MINLNELQQISQDAKNKKAEELKAAEIVYNEEQNIEYFGVMSELDSKLRKAAMEGKTEKVAFYASAYTGSFTDELSSRTKGSNMCVSWDKSITSKDVIENYAG